MQVREIIRVKGGTLFTVAPQQSLAFAIDTMADLDVGSLVVMDGGKMVGMLTFREVLLALKGKATTTENLMVGDVMAVLEEQSFENKMLKSYIKDWPNDQQA